mgnify:FL=1
MTASHRELAIVFADVAGSSALYKRLGNRDAKRAVDGALAIMTSATQDQGGALIKTIGDEIMARFDQPESACLAARAMQREARIAGLALRIGLAYGPTLVEAGDVFGDTVNDAAFVVRVARANQVLLTHALVQKLSQPLRADCQPFDRVAIKGERERSLIYRLEWESPTQSQSATRVMSIQNIAQAMEKQKLILGQGETSWDLDPEQTPYIIGRDKAEAHLLIHSKLASRDHCHIVFRRGKFVLADHSTNGTYVYPDEQPDVYLRREELPLLGSGVIALGQPRALVGDQLIRYSA